MMEEMLSKQRNKNLLEKKKKAKEESIFSKYPTIFEDLDNQVSIFSNTIAPSDSENLMRDDSTRAAIALLSTAFPELNVRLFGSFMLDLHLANSDIDICIASHFEQNPSKEKQIYILKKVRKVLYSVKRYVDILLIQSARVPVLKFTDRETDLQIDIV